MTLDRTKYMNTNEIQQLRTVIQAQNILDLQKGRIRGVVSWMLVDIALSTGLRVSEIANITMSDIDFKRGGIKVVRVVIYVPYHSINDVFFHLFIGIGQFGIIH